MFYSWRRYVVPTALAASGLAVILVYLMGQGRPFPLAFSSSTATPVPAPTMTRDPLFPTRTPSPTGVVITASPTSTEMATSSPTTTDPRATSTATATSLAAVTETTPLATATINPGEISFLKRFGTSGSMSIVEAALDAGLPFGSFLDWTISTEKLTPAEIRFWQTIRVSEDGVRISWEDISAAVKENPDSVWIVGNEPDVKWQDNVTPEGYALVYHDVYTFIKSIDPHAQVAIGGISQSTPLRRAYLDRVLERYESEYGEPMPVDIWTIHGYVLREEAGSWGVDIPPGMEGQTGTVYEIEDHDDSQIFAQNIIDFRKWMVDRGYTNHPLAVTEFGILMPPDYGFPPEVKERFMTEALDFLLEETGDTGYSADGGKLVQWWFWFSLYDPPSSFPSGNLYDPESNQLTYIGQVWADYVNNQ